MIRLSCAFDASVGRFHLEDYVRELEVAVISSDELGQEAIVGRIAATQILWADAEIDGKLSIGALNPASHRQVWTSRGMMLNNR